jgi:hypothetical protein
VSSTNDEFVDGGRAGRAAKIAASTDSGDRVGRLLATLSAFVVGAVCATAARWLGIEQGGLVIAFAVIGAGIQSIALLCFYLYRTRSAKHEKEPFGERIKPARKA